MHDSRKGRDWAYQRGVRGKDGCVGREGGTPRGDGRKGDERETEERGYARVECVELVVIVGIDHRGGKNVGGPESREEGTKF